MMTACKPTTPATRTQSLLSTGPEETGRGQASLWTAAAAPNHRLWTTLRGPLDPFSLPTCPLPRRRRRASSYVSITPIKGETTYDLLQAPVDEPALVNIDSPKQVGHSRASKWAIPACQKQLRAAKHKLPLLRRGLEVTNDGKERRLGVARRNDWNGGGLDCFVSA